MNINFKSNSSFIDNFIDKYQNNKLDKKDILKMLKILKVYNNSNFDRLHFINKYSKTYDAIKFLKKRKSLKSADRCAKLIQIRNAMLQECEQYIRGIQDACKAAVMIAYWWKSSGC